MITMKESKYKIILVTTVGCEGCKIMYNNISKAIGTHSKSISFIEADYKLNNEPFIKKYKFTDFPTTLFIKDNVLQFKLVGTKPIVAIHRYIDVYFK